MVPWNSASGGLAYVWQSKWVGIIAIKTNRTQIHFLSDVLVGVASLDLKVPNHSGASRIKTSTVNLLLSLNVLLEADHYFLLHWSAPKIWNVLPDCIGKRRISISLRNSLRLTFLEKPTVLVLSHQRFFYFQSLFSLLSACLFLVMLVLCKSHCCVCVVDYISMLKCAIEV